MLPAWCWPRGWSSRPRMQATLPVIASAIFCSRPDRSGFAVSVGICLPVNAGLCLPIWSELDVIIFSRWLSVEHTGDDHTRRVERRFVDVGAGSRTRELIARLRQSVLEPVSPSRAPSTSLHAVRWLPLCSHGLPPANFPVQKSDQNWKKKRTTPQPAFILRPSRAATIRPLLCLSLHMAYRPRVSRNRCRTPAAPVFVAQFPSSGLSRASSIVKTNRTPHYSASPMAQRPQTRTGLSASWS